MKKIALHTITILLIAVGFTSMVIASQYPWNSIFIDKGWATSQSGTKETLDVHIDFGEKLSMQEIKLLSGKIKITDKNGEECPLCSYGHSEGTEINIYNKETGEKIYWHADFETFFRFVNPSKTDEYKLHWPEYPPLVFRTPFIRTEKKIGAKKKSKSILSSPVDMRSVCEMQELLTYLGYNPGSVDGVFGAKTEKAITAFQKDHDLSLDSKSNHLILETLRANYGGGQSQSLKLKDAVLSKRPVNGFVFHASKKAEIAPLEIVTPRKGHDFLVKLLDSQTHKTIKIFYIRGGSTVKTKVQLGSLLLKYAAGETWFSKNCLFGKKTVYSKADKTFEFSRTGNRVSGYRVELILQQGGNLATSKISADEW